MRSLAAPRNSRTTQPLYNPCGVRKCAVCGHADRWQRIEWDRNPGGWVCCSPLAPRTHDREMAHTCNTLCGLDGAA